MAFGGSATSQGTWGLRGRGLRGRGRGSGGLVHHDGLGMGSSKAAWRLGPVLTSNKNLGLSWSAMPCTMSPSRGHGLEHTVTTACYGGGG
jgi:hypothetical protein